MTSLEIKTPQWARPYFEPCRYKALKGGRGSGKSHLFAEMIVEALMMQPTLNVVCLREVQRSLRYSAKKLIEDKIKVYKVGKLFKVLDTEIRRIGANGSTTGRVIFNGMQDHTAESIKSLEGFNIAWFEEASRMSNRSLKMLIPTMRVDDSEIWFSWNPDQETDPVEKFLVHKPQPDAIVTHINFTDNVHCPQVIKKMVKNWLANDPDTFDHIWLGAYNTKSDDQVLHGKWSVEEFIIGTNWAGPYYGADWGFSTDPNAVTESWIDEAANKIYIRKEIGGIGIEIDDTPAFFDTMKGMKGYTIRADNARPEMIAYCKRHGYPRIRAAEKWPGSVEDGISKLRSFADIVIHPDCPKTAEEARLYKYARDRLTDDILPKLIDKHNHYIDSIRYSIEPMTKSRKSFWS